MTIITTAAIYQNVAYRWSERKDTLGGALHRAVHRGDLSTVSALLEAGAPVDTRILYASTPLVQASQINADILIVQCLLTNGANPNAEGSDGGTPLLWAVRHGNIAVVRALVATGAEIERENRSGDQPLFIAAQRKDKGRILRELLSHEPSVNTRDDTGQTPLFGAREVEATRLLLERGADPNVVNTLGHTPLWLAVYYERDTDVLRALIDAGAYIDFSGPSGVTPLMLAAGNSDGETVRLLLANGADPSVVDEQGRTAAWYAAENTDVIHLFDTGTTIREPYPTPPHAPDSLEATP